MFPPLFSRRWLLTTLLVFVAAAVMVRLSIWQLDRLKTRRAFNARVLEQVNAPPLQLDADTVGEDLYNMEYRQVEVTGEYLPDDEIVLRNQVWFSQLGVELFTPLRIAGTQQTVLVERGWIPMEDAENPARAAYRQNGTVTVSGVLRRAETDFDINQRLHPDPTLSPGQDRLDMWNNLDLERLGSQMDLPLLPVYIERAPDPGEVTPPLAAITELDLNDGPHLGYAGQWLLFALLLLIGYPFFVSSTEKRRSSQ